MGMANVRIISSPKAQSGAERPQDSVPQEHTAQDQDDFLEALADRSLSNEQLKNRLKHCQGEVALLKGQKAWAQILDLFYPVQDKQPELTAAGLDTDLRLEVGFALGQLGKYDQALKEYEHCLRIRPDHYLAVNSLAYTLYNSLFAAKNREILLTPEARKQRIDRAHAAFRKAQALRPDQVTNFYREGMLFKSLENKPDLALDCFARAVANWDVYSPEQREARHQERKNFIKALYNLASCQSSRSKYKAARESLQRCLAEDRQSGHLKPEHKHFALGKVCYFLAEYDKGVEHLQMAAQLVAPVEGDYVFELLARTRLAQGLLEKGLETLRRIPGKNRRPYVRWTEADLLLGLKKIDEAKEVLLSSVQRDRRAKHKSLIRLAGIAFREKAFQACCNYAEQAVAFHRETYTTPDPDGLFWQAAALLYMGRVPEASQKAGELKAYNPVYPYLQRLLEKIRETGQA